MGRGSGAALALMVTIMVACGGEGATDTRTIVVDEDGSPAPHALVTVRDASGRAITVYADTEGRVEIPEIDAAATLEVRSARAEALPRMQRAIEPGTRLAALTLGALDPASEPRASSYLSQLPDGDRKRRAIVDCGGCHTFDRLRVRKDGRERTSEEWSAAIALMLGLAGPTTGFPIISSDWDVPADAAWFADALRGAPRPVDPAFDAAALDRAVGARLTEWDMPVPMDLAHDVVDLPDGRALITGMFTHQMYVLDPETGEFETEAIPVPNANPRAVDVDDDGRWWVLMGAAEGVARFDPGTSEWDSWTLGLYGHSIALAADGGVWSNGHFTHEPELIVRLDPETGTLDEYEVVNSPTPDESTIPYGLRVGPDGVIWGTQLRGGGLVRLDPATGTAEVFPLPTTHAGPRRLDIAPDGKVWIPEWGGGKLTAFDPATESFTQYDFPVRDAAPYIVRVDQQRGTVWIGTGQADVVASFDPATEDFTLYPLPTRGALIRHIDVEERTGNLWATYSASPGIGGKVLRIEP